MKIALPLAGKAVAAHFGHCAAFALFDVDDASKKILQREDVAAPPHEPGVLPVWLAEKGVSLVLAGGMGSRARALFDQKGIEVIAGVLGTEPEALVSAYLAGTLETGDNLCDH